MREVFRHSNAALVSVHQVTLESAGIQTFVRNLNTQQAIVGGVAAAFFPLPDFWPVLCVLDDADYPAAMEILNDVSPDSPAAPPEWTCPQCHETVPGHFALCWKCQQERIP